MRRHGLVNMCDYVFNELFLLGAKAGFEPGTSVSTWLYSIMFSHFFLIHTHEDVKNHCQTGFISFPIISYDIINTKKHTNEVLANTWRACIQLALIYFPPLSIFLRVCVIMPNISPINKYIISINLCICLGCKQASKTSK